MILPKNIRTFNRFQNVEHRITHVNHLQHPGNLEPFHRTLHNRHFRVEAWRT